MKKYISYILALVISTVGVFAQQIKSGGFSPDTIRPSETTKYIIILEELNGSIDASAIPMPDGLQIVGTSRSQKFSMVNGKTSNQTELIFIVRASKEGEFTVPEWSIEYDSKKFPIKPAKLKVDKNAPIQTPARQSMLDDDEEDIFGFPSIFQRMRNSQAAQMRRIQQAQERQQQELGKLSDHISLKIETPKEKIYVGEAIPAKLVFSYSKTLASEGFKLARLLPQVNKSDAFDCTLFEDKFTTKTDEKDKITVSYDILLTPLKAGSYNLDFNAKGIFLQEYRLDSFFSMPFGGTNQVPFETSTEDQKLTIFPLPEENKPANFSGAVGKFSLSGIQVSPDSLTEGEPCIVSVDVVGMGNFARVNAPELEKSTNWKTYRPKSSFSDESNGMGYVGIKNFKYTIVPTKADIPKTPTLTFSYFDPEKNAYETLFAEGASVSVAPSGKPKAKIETTSTEKKSEPNFEKIITTKDAGGNANLFALPEFWLVQILILVAVVAFVAMRLKKLKIENDPAYAKKLIALKAVDKHLKQAQKAVSQNDVETFLDSARKAIQNAVASNSETCESEAILLNQAQEIMIESGISPEDIETVAVFFTAVDAINYGGFDKSSIDINKLSNALKRICKKLKK